MVYTEPFGVVSLAQSYEMSRFSAEEIAVIYSLCEEHILSRALQANNISCVSVQKSNAADWENYTSQSKISEILATFQDLQFERCSEKPETEILRKVKIVYDNGTYCQISVFENGVVWLEDANNNCFAAKMR